MTHWQRPETAPENTDLLCWVPWDSPQFYVDRFQWVERIVEDVESECTNASGRRRIIQERRVREREWQKGATPDYWMLLPEPPQ